MPQRPSRSPMRRRSSLVHGSMNTSHSSLLESRTDFLWIYSATMFLQLSTTPQSVENRSECPICFASSFHTRFTASNQAEQNTALAHSRPACTFHLPSESLTMTKYLNRYPRPWWSAASRVYDRGNARIQPTGKRQTPTTGGPWSRRGSLSVRWRRDGGGEWRCDQDRGR
jgi:hypothetical protein